MVRLLATLLLYVIQRLFDNYVYNICLSQKSFILRSMRDKYLQNIPCEATVWPHFKGVDCERKSVPAVAVSQPLAAAAQIREQMSGPDLHVFTHKFLALKKPVF